MEGNVAGDVRLRYSQKYRYYYEWRGRQPQVAQMVAQARRMEKKLTVVMSADRTDVQEQVTEAISDGRLHTMLQLYVVYYGNGP